MRFRFSLGKTAWFLGMAVPAAVFGPATWSASASAVAAGLTVTTVVLGHTVGLHRGIIHGAFRMGPRTRAALATVFALTGLGSPLAWLKLHYVRDHHQARADAPRTLRYDHDPLTDLWWTLFCAPETDGRGVGIPERDLSDPWLNRLDHGWLALQAALAILLYAVGGAPWLVWGFFVRNAVVLIGHSGVGYLAHTCGSRRYRVPGACEEGRNLWLLGILSFGEGFHNNHHAAPRSARLGRTPWELDLGWLVVRGLARLGLVHDVNAPADLDDLLERGARRIEDPPEAAPARP